MHHYSGVNAMRTENPFFTVELVSVPGLHVTFESWASPSSQTQYARRWRRHFRSKPKRGVPTPLMLVRCRPLTTHVQYSAGTGTGTVWYTPTHPPSHIIIFPSLHSILTARLRMVYRTTVQALPFLSFTFKIQSERKIRANSYCISHQRTNVKNTDSYDSFIHSNKARVCILLASFVRII